MRASRLLAGALLTGAVLMASAAGAITASAGVASGAQASVTVRTRVASFAIPATHEAHSPFTISGAAQRWTGSAWVPAASVNVAYYYHVLPSGPWVHAGNARTNVRGQFASALSLRPRGHTRWQVRIARQGSGTVYLASASGTHDSFITDRTCITMPVAMHLNGDTAVAGIVVDYCGLGANAASFTGVTGTARFYYHPKGTSTWRSLGTGRAVGSNPGSVAVELGGTLHGYFEIVFPAQGYFLGSTSKTMYLS